jgi:DNA-binding response OmpR family regulator
MCPINWLMVDDIGVGEQTAPDVIKGFGTSVPILVLGGRSGEEDRMLLLDFGSSGDHTDLNPKELLARVRRAMEQLTGAGDSSARDDRELVSFGDVRIDFTSMEATRSGRPVPMTANEFKIVRFFAKFPERAISREVLLNEVWGYQNYPSTRTVDNHILRLRHKLEPDPARPQYFLTIHGAGYKFVPGGVLLEKCG